METNLLCAKQVAAQLGVAERTATRLLRDGEIVAFKVGKTKLWRTTAQQVADYIARSLALHTEAGPRT